MNAVFRSELWWLALGLLTALVIGLITGHVAAFLLLFLLTYCLWLLWRIRGIVSWLEAGGERGTAPPTVGMMSYIVQLIHREKKYSRKQKNRYRAALAQFNSLAAELPDATVVLDDYLQIRWSNTAAATLLGIHPDKDRGQRIDNLIRDTAFHEFLGRRLNEQEIELQAPGNAGITLSVRRVSAGRKLSVLLAHDMTARARVRDMRKAFVGNVSHELRTPLTVIQGHLEMLREDDSLSDVQQGSLAAVSSQADRMLSIVEHLLQLSRLEGNPLAEGDGQAINVAAMVSSMVQTLQTGLPVGRSGNTHFECELDEQLQLLGSENEIYSACHNLVSNAMKYTPPGTRVAVRWYQDDTGKAIFRVRDWGQGIESRHLPRLSERFYRVDAGRSRDAGGTGLGLAIVKHAVQRHGGELRIDSVPGQGSTFTLEFPASRAIRHQGAVNL